MMMEIFQYFNTYAQLAQWGLGINNNNRVDIFNAIQQSQQQQQQHQIPNSLSSQSQTLPLTPSSIPPPLGFDFQNFLEHRLLIEQQLQQRLSSLENQQQPSSISNVNNDDDDNSDVDDDNDSKQHLEQKLQSNSQSLLCFYLILISFEFILIFLLYFN